MNFNHTTFPINLEFTHTNEASICIATLILGDEVYVSRGSAKRHPQDRFDREIGEKLSASRAMRNLTNKIAKQASGKIKCNDDNRQRYHKPNPKDKKETLDDVISTIAVQSSTSPSLISISTNPVGSRS